MDTSFIQEQSEQFGFMTYGDEYVIEMNDPVLDRVITHHYRLEYLLRRDWIKRLSPRKWALLFYIH